MVSLTFPHFHKPDPEPRLALTGMRGRRNEGSPVREQSAAAAVAAPPEPEHADRQICEHDKRKRADQPRAAEVEHSIDARKHQRKQRYERRESDPTHQSDYAEPARCAVTREQTLFAFDDVGHVSSRPDRRRRRVWRA
jgi:hypothetical protein